ncbi:adenylate/guanylate cyclase domain-containing protein [bacterium]|nr:adenylate/guanylate cyclase domain-containing protein [bacterium]
MKKNKNKLFFYINSCIVYCILAISVFILSAIYLEPNVKSFFISNFSANTVGTPNIVEVVIDDTSISKYPWPWANSMYTEILDYFHTYAKPKSIGLDIFLPTLNPMSKSDTDFARQIGKMDNLVTSFTPESGEVENSDKEFMNMFQKKYALQTNPEASSLSAKYQKVSKLQPFYYDVIKNSASVRIERDTIAGNVFSATNLIKIGDYYYPSLPLKMYLYENNTNEVKITDTHIEIPKTKLKIPHKLILDGIVQTDIRYYANRIVEQDGRYINTYNSHLICPAYKIIESYRHLKEGKLQKDDIPPEIFKDAVIFIGINISGPSADVFKTPMENRHPGVDIQATVYDNISNNHFLHNTGFLIQFLNILILSLITFILVIKWKFLKSLFAIIILDIIFFILASISAYNGYLMSFINPISVQLITLIFGYSFKFISENRNKEKIKQAMGKYLSQDIMKNVVSNIDDLKLGGKRAIVTVLFSDIRGFTSLSEKMSAEEVSMILNEYFSEMEPIITKYNGVINKFIGDAVMAIFGEPIQDINHAQNAVKCAYEMLKKVEYLREKWLYEGKPKIEIGIGINTGEVFIGNIGTETRMEYTVIGDTVNLASRIESYNKVYRTNLLVSSSTYSHIADIADVIKISEVQIRGKAKKMNIYEVLRIDKNQS